jgi:hypothetical protein
MNEALRAELMAMEQHDRAVRAELVTRGELHGAGYHPKMAADHREHNARLRTIVAAHGWPGRSLVGDDGCRAAGFVVQHALLDPELQRQCVGLLQQAVAADEAFPFMLAFLTDRVLMEQGQPQLYGTQHVGGPDGALIPWTIAEPEGVEERRRAMGLPPLEQRTAELRAQMQQERGAKSD